MKFLKNFFAIFITYFATFQTVNAEGRVNGVFEVLSRSQLVMTGDKIQFTASTHLWKEIDTPPINDGEPTPEYVDARIGETFNVVEVRNKCQFGPQIRLTKYAYVKSTINPSVNGWLFLLESDDVPVELCEK